LLPETYDVFTSTPPNVVLNGALLLRVRSN
jgi:hypothetical protein